MHNMESYKAPLSKLILKEYNKLIQVVSQVPASLMNTKNIEGTGGVVTVQDIIAYNIGWGSLLIGWYKAGLQSKMPQMPGEGFTTWDYSAIAHHFYAKYAHSTLPQLLELFHDLVMEIVAIAEVEHEKGNLDALGVWSWCTLKSGKQWPLSKWIRVNTVAPYKRSAGLVRKMVRAG